LTPPVSNSKSYSTLLIPHQSTDAPLPFTQRISGRILRWNGLTGRSGLQMRKRQCRSQYEEAAADVDTTEASQRPAVDDDITLDPLQQARKRRQRLAAI